ncbi:MAG: hypothetical protein RLZZ450_155 [Pseudomonadota bacterium]|jgi:RNA polymerase sigma-70 factor (ECF subfamily)
MDTDEQTSERLLRLLEPLHHQAVLTARRLSRSRADGDDLFQDAVLRAFDRLGTLREEARFRSWFFAILLRLHRQRHRRDFWRRLLPLDQVAEPAVEPAFADEGAQRMARALATLNAKEREALVLSDLSEFRLDEIAALQGDSLAAIKSRVVRARARLRARYLRDAAARGPLALKEELP